MEERFIYAKIAGIAGIIGNLFLLILKGTIGFWFHSQAMIADAANSATDIFASCMTFIGSKIASEPSDKTHNFGHGKAEYIFSLFISISMIVLSLKLLYDSIFSLVYQEKFTFSWLLILVCMITILVKAFLYFFTSKMYHKYPTILLEANRKDHRNDCILTSCTLISIIFSFFEIYWLDGLVGILIAIWIFISGVKIFVESFNILMDISLDSKTQDIILDLIHQYPQIQKVDPISSAPVGYQYLIVLTVYLDGSISTFESHSIVDCLEKDITALDNVYQTIIHVNPIEPEKKP